MNQPDLGLKIAELRQQKSFTQKASPLSAQHSVRQLNVSYGYPLSAF